MHKQHLQTAYRKYAVLIGTIFEDCDRRKLSRHAKGPIPEDDFPRPMPDSPKGEYPFRLAAARQATFPKGTAFRGGGTVPG